MKRNFDRNGALRRLIPINRLPPENQEKLLDASTFLEVNEGDTVYVQGRRDDHVHYLIEGAIEFFWNEKAVQRLAADSKMAQRALDKPGRKRHTVRVVSDCIVLRIPRAVYDAQLEEGDLLIGPRQVEVSEIAGEKSSNWMIKMLQSDLFSRLSATNIQKIFGRMERISVAADQAIVNQGESGDYYYVVEHGYCEVSRKIPGGKEIHLADLSAGDAFGEGAIVGDRDRDATVTMLSDGSLMRLPHADFMELIRDPLLHKITIEAARLQIAGGAHWLDIRYPEDYAKTTLRNSQNIPFNVLRLKAHRVDKTKKYIVGCDDRAQSAIAAYLFIERGVNVDYLDGSLSELITRYPDLLIETDYHVAETDKVVPISERVTPAQAKEARSEESEMDKNPRSSDSFENTIDRIDGLYSTKLAEEEQASRVPVESYAHTITGQRLADLIDEMAENKDQLPEDEEDVDTNGSGTAQSQLGQVFDIAPDDEGAASVESSDVLLVDTRAPLPVSHDETLSDEMFDMSEGLTQLLQDFEYRVREHVESVVLRRASDVETRYQDKLKRLRRAAAIEVRKRQEVSRQRYEMQYKKKELQLRAHYKKLMALANKISEQKAQLQIARQQFEEKLSAANAVYKQVEDMRKTLRQHIGDLPTALIDRDRESA